MTTHSELMQSLIVKAVESYSLINGIHPAAELMPSK